MPRRKVTPADRAGPGTRLPAPPGRAGAGCPARCGWPLDPQHPAGLQGGHPCCAPGALPGKMTETAVVKWAAAYLAGDGPLSPSPWTAELGRLAADRDPLPSLL